MPPETSSGCSGATEGCEFMSLDTSPAESTLASSAALKALLDSPGELLAVLQPDRTLSFANEGFLRILGHAPSELLGRTLDLLHHPAEFRTVRDQFQESRVAP